MKFAILWMAFAAVSTTSAQKPMLLKEFEWFQKDHILQTVVFQPNGEGLALVRRFQPQDSLTITHPLEDRQTIRLLPPKETSSRLKDPVVALLEFKSRRLTLVDYGWTPAFSPNGQRLVYVHQSRPINGGKIIASALKDNFIRLFSIPQRTSMNLIPAPATFLMDPVFVDSMNIVYKIGDAVNGPYAGAISLNQFNLNTKKSQLVKGASIRHRLYDLVGEVYPAAKGNYYYTYYSPQDSGTGLAGEYEHLLMKGKDTVFNFGVRRFQNLEYKFAIQPRQGLMLVEDNHFMTEDTSYLAQYQQGKMISKKALNINFSKIYLSPNGKYLIYIRPDQVVWVLNLATMLDTQVPIPAGEIHSVSWAPNSEGFAIIQDHSTLSKTDALYVFKVD